MTAPRRPKGGGPKQGRRRHPATRRPVLDGSRLTAYDVLDGVSSRAAYANLLLPQLLRERQLDERDAAFATQLAYGTLREPMIRWPRRGRFWTISRTSSKAAGV